MRVAFDDTEEGPSAPPPSALRLPSVLRVDQSPPKPNKLRLCDFSLRQTTLPSCIPSPSSFPHPHPHRISASTSAVTHSLYSLKQSHVVVNNGSTHHPLGSRRRSSRSLARTRACPGRSSRRCSPVVRALLACDAAAVTNAVLTVFARFVPLASRRQYWTSLSGDCRTTGTTDTTVDCNDTQCTRMMS